MQFGATPLVSHRSELDASVLNGNMVFPRGRCYSLNRGLTEDNNYSLGVRLRRIIWASCFAAVVVGSVLPGNSGPMQELARLAINDKVEHFVAYAVLSGLFPRVWRVRRNVALAAIFALVLMGSLLEVIQLFVPGRTADPKDALADLAGVTFGAFAAFMIRASVRRYRSG
jgi:VanZ family protein